VVLIKFIPIELAHLLQDATAIIAFQF